ncbi:MAG: cation:proton antiporter [Dehalococcoidia bacterium]|nr:cation:proton antiporter [Dehalococcoidia bacterium]
MDESSAVASLAILLASALVGGMIAHRLRQPIILGYLVIGAAIGPNALGWVSDRGLVESVATIGVALLMFTLGLEVSVAQLRQVGRVGVWGGVAQIALTAAAGLLIGYFGFKWTLAESAVFGMGVSLSSTMVCLKILMDRGEVDSTHGRIMVAVLIIQDIAIVVLVLLESLLGASGQNPFWLLAEAVAKAAIFVVVAVAAGTWVLPWLLGVVGGVRTRELFLLTVVVLCLAAALGTSVLGLSVVFGAFIVGLVLRESKFASQVLAEVTPLRDVFATLFFVSLGMLLDLRFVADNWVLVLTTVAAISAIKIGLVSGIVRLFGYNGRIAVFTGFGLFQIGEFSFILAQTGINMGIVSQDFYSLIVASAIITMLLTPLSMGLVSWLHHRAPLSRLATLVDGSASAEANPSLSVESPETVLIAGYGRVGQNVARALRDARVPCIVIDVDPEVTYKARCDRVPSVYGDASNIHVLSSLDVGRMKALVVTYSDPLSVMATVQAALKLNPQLRIVARVHRQEDVGRIERLGVVELVSPEYEASVELVRRILSAEGWLHGDIASLVDRLRASSGVCELGPQDDMVT